LTRLSLLLAASCLGTGAALVGGRALLEKLPPLTPATPSSQLERLRRWAPDPGLRREANLLLAQRFPGDARLQRTLLGGLGWGTDPVAAVALKNAALNAAALGEDNRALQLWETLLQRFRGSATAADALYALGRRRPALRAELMQRFPAHPAALAAALEAGPAPADRLAGALHLARWGARWPGAAERLRQACRPGPLRPTAPQRASLAAGIAQLGDGDGALACLGGGAGDPARAAATSQLNPAGQLDLARALLQGSPEHHPQALALLLEVARQGGPGGDSPEADEAVRLLAQQKGPEAQQALDSLPEAWRASAPVASRRALADPKGADALTVLRRWPDDPASWELQWELARRQFLAGQWDAAATLLRTIPAERLPAPLAARSRFWLGMIQRQQGDGTAAAATWRDLRQHSPGGYYGWRAAVQLGEANHIGAGQPTVGASDGGDGPPGGAADRSSDWQPLASGDPLLDRLWRLDQRDEVWETWRARRGNTSPRQAAELLVEGRLRQGVGDDWTGLGQLEQASLRLRPDQCALLPQLERSLHPQRFLAAFRPVAKQRQLPLELLQGLAKQESRFTPTVQSAAGAVGLMQLMPATAAELAGGPVSTAELERPERNVALGGAYLKGLLLQWKGDPLPAVASYNAGPGAVEGWVNPRLRAAPELWVEAIPFPETRLYVKKVLGNAWSYRQPGLPGC
jgi:soluble lytic murein transglycosylase